MRIFNLNTLLSVKEGRPEGDNDIDQEAEVDAGINCCDNRAGQRGVPLLVVEYLQRDQK